MKHALIALLLGTTCCTTSAQSLGRLFYSEAERAQLEQQRGTVVQQASAPRPLGAVRHDGVVMRSAGPATWFVNGIAVPPQDLPSLPARPAGTALKLQGSAGGTVRLRPGEHAVLDETGQATQPVRVIDIQRGRAP
ncbi:MAG: hypothetical protein KBF58_10065 [Methyloversatilis sp.]|jgi:hypothetical protein|nr:hypothetical protein [Methyloversatilis sp.]MBP6195124.1 hypothetical protein [Methyloversatilis sp.]MBP9118414.1 hypothetical protein [Methyloversatilis sp.]